MNRKLNKIDKWKFNNGGQQPVKWKHTFAGTQPPNMFAQQFDGSQLNPGHQAVSSAAKGPLTVGQAGMAANMGAGLVSAVAGDSVGGAGLSGALSGAGAGAMFGPVGMGVGAVVGGVTSLIGASAEKKAEEEALRKQNMANQKMAINQANMAGNTNIPTFRRGGTVRFQNGGMGTAGASVAQGPEYYAQRMYEYQSQPGFNPEQADIREHLGGDPYMRNNAQSVAAEYARNYPDANYAFEYDRPSGDSQNYGFRPPLKPINRSTEVERSRDLAPMKGIIPQDPWTPPTQPNSVTLPNKDSFRKHFGPGKKTGTSSNTGWETFEGNFAYGGETMPMPNAELEGDEVLQTPQGQVATIQGPTHEQGGVDMNLDPGTRVYSDRLKGADGIKFSDKADGIRKRMGKFERIMNDSRGTKLAKYTAKLMLEKINKELDGVFQEQESMKQQQGIEGPQQMFAVGGEVGEVDFEPKTPLIHKLAYNDQLFNEKEFRVERRKAPRSYEGGGEYMYVLVAKDSYNDNNRKRENWPSYMLIDEDSYNMYKQNKPEMVFDIDKRMPTSYNRNQWAYTDGEFIQKAFGTGTEKARAATASFINPTFEVTGSSRPQSPEAGLESIGRSMEQTKQVEAYNTGQQQISTARNRELHQMRGAVEDPNPPVMDELMQETEQRVDNMVDDASMRQVPTRGGLAQPTGSPLKVEQSSGKGGPYHAIHGSYETDNEAKIALEQIKKDFPNAKIVKTNIGWNGISIGEYKTKEEGFEAVRGFKDGIKAGNYPNVAWSENPKYQTWLKNIRKEDLVDIDGNVDIPELNRQVSKLQTEQPTTAIQSPNLTQQQSIGAEPITEQQRSSLPPNSVYGGPVNQRQQPFDQPQLPPEEEQFAREEAMSPMNRRETLPRSQENNNRFVDPRLTKDPRQRYDVNNMPPYPTDEEYIESAQEEEAITSQPQGQFPGFDQDPDAFDMQGTDQYSWETYPSGPQQGPPGDYDTPGGGPSWGDLLEYSPTIYNAIKAMGARRRANRIDREFDPGQYTSSRLVEPRRTSLDPIRRELEGREAASNRAMRNVGADATGSVYNRMMANTGQTRRALADTALKEDATYTQNKLQADMFNVETDKFNRQMRFQGDAARRQAHAANESFLPNALKGAAGIAGQRRLERNQAAMDMTRLQYAQHFGSSFNVYDPNMPVRKQGEQYQAPNLHAGSGIWGNEHWSQRPIFGGGRRARRNNTQ